jgi:hypothetical protein
MVLGIGLIVFSVLYIINSCVWLSPQEMIFPFLLLGFVIFVFVLDCMLLDEIVRRDDDCSGARGTPRLFMIWWSVPLALFGCVYGGLRPNHDGFYDQPQYAEFKLVL